MKVEELIIDGFKSYAARTVISGWDSQFNAITGLNGSGKSNILDAICFVLGIASMSTVRASNLQDLIYKRGQAGVTKASVTIVFNNSEISKSPIGFENCPTISVTRQIILGGTSKYLINGHKAQQQTVLNLFQSVQLNINNPNFLIMQGKITKVLNMKPSEILSLIEEAAGTRTFEERKDKAQKTMAKKEAKLTEIRNLLKEEIEPKLEKLRNEKRNFLEFQQTQIDLEKMSRIIAAYDYTALSKHFTDQSNYLSQHESRVSALHLEVDRLNHEILNLNEDLNQAKAKKEENLKTDGNLKDLEGKENQLSNELTRLNTARDITLENLKEEKKKHASLQKQLQQLKEQLRQNEESYSNHEQEYKTHQAALNKSKEDFVKKQELLSTLSTGISSKGSTSGAYTSELNEAKENLNASENFIKTSKLKIGHLNQQISSDQVKLVKAKTENESLLSSIASHRDFILERQKEIDSKLGFEPSKVYELRDLESNLVTRQNKLNRDLNYMKRDISNLDFQYSRPSPDFRDELVRGVVAQLFNLPDSSHNKALALQVCAGGRLYNVVVDNSTVASQLLEKGRLRRRVTIIPLDKISSRSIDPNVIDYAKQVAPNKVELALNLIEFEEELHKAMAYIFGSTFICDDPNSAKAVTFDPKIKKRSITLEGDIYDPEGNLSGGSRKNNSTILLKVRQYNKLAGELKQVDAELHGVRQELDRMDSLIGSTKTLQNEINLKRHELSLLEKRLESNPASLILKQNESNQQEIVKLTSEIEEHEQKCQDFRQEIVRIEKDIAEFNSDKGSKINDLKKQVSQLKLQVAKKEKELEDHTDSFQAAQVESEQQKAEIVNVQESIGAAARQIDELTKKSQSQLQDNEKLQEELSSMRAELEDARAKLLGLDEEINELTQILKHKTEVMNSSKLEIQKITHELEKAKGITKNLKTRLDDIISDHEWVIDGLIVDNIIQQYPNININESRDQLSVLQEKFQSMRRKVNVNIMSMIDNVEKKEASLKTMVKTIEKDKNKIVNTINKLNGYKRDTLNTTYQKVSVDFGQIFSDLLPGSFAKLVPVNMMDVTKGLEVKVKLGEVWKESLVELSGGQRSLIALSLIMALLQFKPAPMYILDEVDAALDLSHTQNIGHLIKTRFKGSQFIVVSLKEGMFTNANRVFRTRFQDGTSVVSVM
ncbi:Structural maintenance of chromosomes protein 2 [Candida viswanathii]|uniref:Structural maintenance of chromosomes protein n=1 Tax=Candida viswanathii TaxID=5486 RepID=A0A367XLB3_9ASCO|nr:Structural maintenance of chromosomes protein 2 [Candida viswanathii]